MVCPSTIQKILEANPRAASTVNSLQQTPLRLHCQRRNASAQVAGLLLEQYPDALTKLDNQRGWAPIHAAAANANFNLLCYLVDARPEAAQVRTSQRLTALHLLCQSHAHLSAPVDNNNNGSNNSSNNVNNNADSDLNAAIESLLQADPEAILHKDPTHGQAPLHLVCKTEGSRQVPLPVVKILLKCNPRAAAVFEQYLPLHYACEMGCSPEVVRALLKACPNDAGALTHKQDSALSLACTYNKNLKTVNLLIAANPESLKERNVYGFSPLHSVCRAHQPRMGIVKAILEACPESVLLQTNPGETPIQLAESNSGTFAGVLQLLTQTQDRFLPQQKTPLVSSSGGSSSNEYGGSKMRSTNESISTRAGGGLFSVANSSSSSEALLNQHGSNNNNEDDDTTHDTLVLLNNNYRNNYRPNRNTTSYRIRTYRIRNVTTNKMGNTPLHDACFRSTPYEDLEKIARENPKYILDRNNVGHTPLQILCENDRIDVRITSTFARIGGPEIFSVKDSNGNTPLHAAMRKSIDMSSLRSLIRVSPDALRSQTNFGDTPLHLACLRECSDEVIREVAMAASSGDVLPALVPNLVAQTPIGIVMAKFKDICQEGDTCCISATYHTEQRWVFDVLSTLVKIAYYGPSKCQQGMINLSLLRACVVLHRQNLRLDPAFIRQAIHVYPEEVKLADDNGNYPLHIEASIPIEKMPLLDGACGGKSHSRMGILGILLEAFPQRLLHSQQGAPILAGLNDQCRWFVGSHHRGSSAGLSSRPPLVQGCGPSILLSFVGKGQQGMRDGHSVFFAGQSAAPV